MTLRIELHGIRPGYGRLELLGWEAATENLEIAIQRNSDGSHLAHDQQWQSTEYWHAPERVSDDQGRLNLELGPDIIDAIVIASGVQFKLFVRSGDVMDSGILRTVGRFLGSEAGHDSADSQEASAEAIDAPNKRHSAANEALEQTADVSANQLADDRDQGDDGQARETIERDAGAHRVWAAVAILLLLVGVAWSAWFFLVASEQQKLPVSKTSTPKAAVVTTAVGGFHPTVPVEAGGNDRVLRFFQGSPTPTLIYARAAGWEQEGDCDAAMIAYRKAAQAEAASAFKFAQRYDPDRFLRGGCIAEAKAETAAFWYEKAASSGNPAAQRRLGELLIENHPSGPLYQSARQWLQKAADQGDRRARSILKAKQK